MGRGLNFFFAIPLEIPSHLLENVDISGLKLNYLKESFFHRRLLLPLLGGPFAPLEGSFRELTKGDGGTLV